MKILVACEFSGVVGDALSADKKRFLVGPMG